jgi:hypothetical protein
MTCDFSDAERLGFEQAIMAKYATAIDPPLLLEQHYRFCEVHFKQSLTRVRRNGAIVPPAKEMVFYEAVLRLLEPQPEEMFDAKTTNI